MLMIQILIKIIVILILMFLGGFAVGFFEDQYKKGISAAIIIFYYLGIINTFIWIS